MVHALSNDRALRSGNCAYPFDAYHHNLYCIDDAREMKINILTAPVNSVVLRSQMLTLIKTALGGDLDAAYLYRSRARGDAKPDSDWDLLVMLHDDADWSEARAKMRRLTGEIAGDINERLSILPLRWSDADENAGLLTNVAREEQFL